MWFSPYLNIYVDSKSSTAKKIAKYKNELSYQRQFVKNMTDALHRYDIENVPDTCSKRVIMQSLLWHGSVFFIKKSDNIIALPGFPDGSGMNLNGDFNGAHVYGCNGYNERVSVIMPGANQSYLLKKTINGSSYVDGTAVLVRENEVMYPFINNVEFFASAISDTMRTLDVSRENMKRPFIISCQEEVIPTVKSYFNHAENNENFIISSGIFPADKISVIPFDRNPDYLKSASELIDWYEHKFRELCGIDNTSQIDKKGENLVSAEVNINEEQTNLSIDKTIDCLNDGLAIANKAFGLNMKAVKYQAVTERGIKNEDIFRNDTSEFSDLSE